MLILSVYIYLVS